MKCLAIALLIVSVVCTAYAAGDAETVVELTDKAVETFAAKGKDYTMKLLNASTGPLRKGAIYAFAVDFKGRILSHPVQEELRNSDSWELQDAKGKFLIQDFIKIAKEQNQGWCEYWWLRVNEASPTLKRTYIKKVPGEELLIGAGYYVK